MFLETIRVSHGHFKLLPLHTERMRRTMMEVYGKPTCSLHLSESDIPEDMRKGEVKCRVRYGKKIESVEYECYSRRDVRSLKLMGAPLEFDYHLKYADRSALSRLREKRGDADEIVIVREGLITDTSYSNLLFNDGDTLITPRSPLLEGVMRRHLLEIGAIREADISVKSMQKFRSVILINAMLPLGTMPEIPISSIS